MVQATIWAISDCRRYIGPVRRLSSCRSSQTNACPDDSGPGGGSNDAGILPCKCQVRNNGVPSGYMCGNRRRCGAMCLDSPRKEKEFSDEQKQASRKSRRGTQECVRHVCTLSPLTPGRPVS